MKIARVNPALPTRSNRAYRRLFAKNRMLRFRHLATQELDRWIARYVDSRSARVDRRKKKTHRFGTPDAIARRKRRSAISPELPDSTTTPPKNSIRRTPGPASSSFTLVSAYREAPPMSGDLFRATRECRGQISFQRRSRKAT